MEDCQHFKMQIHHNWPWHRVPRETVAAPSLELSKARLEPPGIVEAVPAQVGLKDL